MDLCGCIRNKYHTQIYRSAIFCDLVVISNRIPIQAIKCLRSNKHQIDTLKSQDNRIFIVIKWFSILVYLTQNHYTAPHQYKLCLSISLTSINISSFLISTCILAHT